MDVISRTLLILLFIVNASSGCYDNSRYAAIDGVSQLVHEVSSDGSSATYKRDPWQAVPSQCLKADPRGVCNLLVTEFDGGKQLWLPSTDVARPFQLITRRKDNQKVANGLEGVGIRNCLRFFPTAREDTIGALCTQLDAQSGESTLVYYTIQCTSAGDCLSTSLGVGTYIEWSNHTPIVVLNTTAGPLVVYATYLSHIPKPVYKLFVVDFDLAFVEYVDLPSECDVPRDLQALGRSSALLLCANGHVLFFNSENYALTVVNEERVDLIASCHNSSGFVMFKIQSGTLIFNKSEDNIRQAAVMRDHRDLVVRHAACYWNGTASNLYITADNSTSIYRVSLELLITDQASFETAFYGNKQIHSLTVDQSILSWVCSPQNGATSTAYIQDLTDGNSVQTSVEGTTAFVTLLSSGTKCDGDIDQDVTEKQHGLRIYVIPIVVAVASCVVIAIVVILFVVRSHRPRTNGRQYSTTGETGLMLQASDPHGVGDLVAPSSISSLVSREQVEGLALKRTRDALNQLPSNDNTEISSTPL